MIKKIHQIWIQGVENIPNQYKPNIQKIKELNPNWVYNIYSDKELRNECSKYSQQCLDVYDKYKYMHQKIDLGRYVILYNNGGLSVDMDTEVLKSFDNIPQLDTNTNKLVVSKINLNRIESFVFLRSLEIPINNAHIYSPEKQNIVLKKLIDTVLAKPISPKNSKTMDILFTTGPVAFSSVINKNKKDVIILDSIYFEPNTIFKEQMQNKDTIIIHKMDNTWVSGNAEKKFIEFYGTTRNFLNDNKIIIMLVSIILLLGIVLYKVTTVF